VILSLQLSFAVVPLVLFTSDRAKMGEFANPRWVKVLAWIVAVIIAGLNVYLLALTFRSWLA
jgi:manganese transport protein